MENFEALEEQAVNILVVDDEPVISELVYHWLTMEGYECSTASHAEMALQMLQERKFELVISDIMMPRISGIELLSIVKSRYPETAVVMITAVDDRKTAMTTLQLGAYGYIIKPFDRNDLLINVANALERRRLTLLSQEYERSLEARVRLNEKYEKLVHVFPAGIAEFALPKPISCATGAEEFLTVIFNARVTQGNPEFAKLSGRQSVEELQGMRLGEILPQDEDNLHEYEEWIKGCFSTHSFETKESGPNRAKRYFENTLVGNVHDKHLTVFWCTRRDITAARRVQEALVERIRTIDALYQHVLEAGKAKAIMDHTAQVAHELRQPLAIIGGFARRLAKGAQSGAASSVDSLRESVGIMINEVRRLEEILAGLVDFTHHEMAQTTGVNPHELIRYVIDINRPRLEEKYLRAQTHFSDPLEEILVDPDRFQQVVRNLLANAIEASPFGGVIRVETSVTGRRDGSDSTDLTDSDRYFEIRIHNFGRPIATENIQKIFDPFFTTKAYGTGMGLTLARKIVEDHRGSLSLKSDDGGTVATVWIPAVSGTREADEDRRDLQAQEDSRASEDSMFAT
jgi:signal transduction histidine kinase